MTTKQQEGASPAWYAIIVSLAGVVVLVADQVVRPLLAWWAWPLVAIAGAAVTFTITQIQMMDRANGGWLKVVVYRELVWAGLGFLATWVDRTGWSVSLGLWWIGGTIAVAALGTACPTPPLVARDQPPAGWDRRPDYVRKWEQIIRNVTSWKTVTVSRWERWENAAEGFRLWVELPTDTGNTDTDLAQHCQRFAHAARLRAGCHVQALPSDVQGVAILDVMEVDNLSKSDHLVHVEPTTPASINDSFTVMTTPRGKPLDICLRIETATIGGATGSGKTTLLNRIISFLARCTDCLIWVADYNGGGLANNWIEPWARGKCARPVVDWVATDENEFALMTAVALAISTARKHNPEVRRRMRQVNSGGVLPVSRDLPAIIVLADEGGSIRQKLTALGTIAAEGMTQLAQLGRAMAVRSMISVLRGTSDLMDKGFRTQSSIRLCLRMNEHGEYVHVLDVNPPKSPLKHKGAGYLRTMELDQPVYGRTVNVDEDAIEQHAIACSQLRPVLDQYSLDVAARVRPQDVTGGMKDYPGWVGSRQFNDCTAGKAYTGRWERAAALLANLRDEEYTEAPISRAVTASASPTPALDSWMADSEPAPVASERTNGIPATRPQAAAQPAGAATGDQDGVTARRRILAALREVGEAGITASDLLQRSGVSKQRMYQLLPELKTENAVGQNADGLYVLAEHAVTVG